MKRRSWKQQMRNLLITRILIWLEYEPCGTVRRAGLRYLDRLVRESDG